MNNEDIEYIQTLLTNLTTMDVISLHSFLRLDDIPEYVRIADLIDAEDEEDKEIYISAIKLLAYVEVEFQKRNLN